jgi:hypothetical protein
MVARIEEFESKTRRFFGKPVAEGKQLKFVVSDGRTEATFHRGDLVFHAMPTHFTSW